jgi:hypothetical protein
LTEIGAREMSKTKELVSQNSINTSSIIEQTFKSLLEGVTGIAASDRKDLILSIGHIFQRIRSGRFLDAL